MSTPRLARDNPFAMHHLERIPFKFETGVWSLHLQRLGQMNYCGAVVGPQGSGKTTLLLELHEILKQEFLTSREIQFVLIDEDSKNRKAQIQTLKEGASQKPILLVDGIERAGWLQRKQLFRLTRNGTGLIAAVHQRCQISTWINCETDPQLLQYTLEQLVGNVSHHLSERAVLRFKQRDGNIRLALRDLYDDWSEKLLPLGE